MKGWSMTEANDGLLSHQESEERFDLLVADVREYAIFVIEPNGSVVCWNLGAERLLGYQSQ
jgi:PAS domain S-box-containing protein